jgi:general secretion pathway protein E
MAANPNSPTEPIAIEAPGAGSGLRHLPFAFAKRHGVLIQDLSDGVAHAIYRKGAGLQSLAEVRRFAGMPVRFAEVDPTTFDARLQNAYDRGGRRRR